MLRTVINPPNPASRLLERCQGQQVISLVRSMENEEDEKEYLKILENVGGMLKDAIRLCAMKGLIQGDQKKAELILATNASSDGNTNQDNSLKKKRGRRKSEQSKSSAETPPAAKDESLLFSAMLRILSWDDAKFQSGLLLVKLCADLCTAMSEFIKSNSIQQFSRIGSAEYELISLSGIPLLKALCNAGNQLLSRINLGQVQQHILLNTDLKCLDKEIITLRGCLKAAASLVELFGTKLSRSSGLVSDLQKLGLAFLTIPCYETQATASKLIAALPLTGAIYEKGTAVGEQWSRMLMDSVTGLSEMLRTMAPVGLNSDESQSALDTWQRSKGFDEFLEQLKLFFRERLPLEGQRAPAFRFCVHGLFQLSLCLLERDYNCPNNDAISLYTRICMEQTLNLLEDMMSFSFAAEKLFLGTKKRLRSEVMEGGVLSPSLVVSEVATTVCLLGHELFDTLVSAMSYPSLLPHANRILRMTSKALFQSTSAAVRKAVDPSAISAQPDGESNEWLSTSISLRIRALHTFTVTISMWGFYPSRNNNIGDASSWFNTNNSIGAEKCVSAIAGCILEQLWLDSEESGDWGTFEDRVELAIKSAHCLESTVLSCGGFMPLEVRVLIDSIASASLDAIIRANPTPVAAYSCVQVAIIRLGCACVSTPWPSGASSPLQEKLYKVAQRCRTHDAETSAASVNALRLCVSIATPRVPPLYIDKQIYDFSASRKPVSASVLLADIQKAMNDECSNRGAVNEDAPKENGQPTKKRKENDPTPQGEIPKKSTGKREVIADDEKEAKSTNNFHEPDEKHQAHEPDEKHQATPPVPAQSDEQTRAKSEDEADDDDFLPDIVDDDGPDEDDA